jgi:hypothetical protein
MKDLAPFIYPLINAALVLLNYVIQRVTRRREQQRPPDAESGPAPDHEAPQRRARELKQLDEQLQRRRQSQLQRGESSPAQSAPRSRAPAEGARNARRTLEEPAEVREARTRRLATPLTAEISAPRRSEVRTVLADRRSLRRAFVIMAVLGPCRAQQTSDDYASP